MNGAADFTKMVPGFDFLQNLMKGAAAGLPSAGGVLPQISQWIAPTLDPAELEKRIQDLKTVQFWLEQNSRLLGTTIQALEVQRMTLSTLKSMNLPLADLGAALRAQMPAATEPTAAPHWAAQTPATAPAPEPAPEPAPAPTADAKADTAAAATPAIDPMKWWGALTQQFTEIAAQALREQPAPAEPAPAKRAVKTSAAPLKRAAKRSAAKKAGAGKGRTAAGAKPARARG